MDSTLEPLARSLRDAPVVDRDGYHYFVHGVTDGIPPVEPDVLRAIATGIRDRIDLAEVDKLVAPEAMGIHHATALSLATDLPFVVVRKRAYGFPEEIVVRGETGYSESDLYLNGVDAGDRVVLVDDVLSSGGTIEAVCDALEECGADLQDIVVVLRRVDGDHDLDRPVTSLLDVRVEDGELVIVD
ncbi:hypoxanthine/guanine phosphoribosyltransferase [Halosolutus amylolyticus]|uniref:Hypoxanthine/guanine phosphoribosyltransferase n=1 Tax=Halosolutus amylolyticus TaxID=2932267 RepID=A0ABD5PPV1_9EURY|nr:hypoxanthine/guanine phosphoribosyltransferase [Halosolutus amylolyticus]